MKIRILRFLNSIKSSEIPAFRGAVIKYAGNENILLHNHTDVGLRYSYPLIQYKLIDGRASIVCINEGIDIFKDMISGKSIILTLGNHTSEFTVDKVDTNYTSVQISEFDSEYTIENWLPLNQENYHIYSGLEGIVEKCTLLQRILIGNILSFAKGTGISIDSRIRCKITGISEAKMLTYKDIKMTALNARFRTNVLLPDKIGLGKGCSQGFGTITAMNKHILISLVSDQTIPNVQLFKEFQDKITDMVFITTDDMKVKNTQSWILDACKAIRKDLSERCSVSNITVDKHDYGKIIHELTKAFPARNNTYGKIILNITGGTKMISLAVFEFFKANFPDTEVYYIGEKGVYYRLFPDPEEMTLSKAINLKEYLTAYGFTIFDREGISGIPFETTCNLLDRYNEITSKYGETLNGLRKRRNSKKMAINEEENIPRMLESIGLIPKENGYLQNSEIKYLTGGWFEEYIYYSIKKELNLDDNNILTGITLVKDIPFSTVNNAENLLGEEAADKDVNTKNEIDVIFFYGNRLHIIECKTSITYNDNGKEKNFLTEILYKADSLSSKFGLRAQTVIVTLSDFLETLNNAKDKSARNNKLQLFIEQIDRANLSRIKILDGRMIKSKSPIARLLNL